jgi:hypothetical protein
MQEYRNTGIQEYRNAEFRIQNAKKQINISASKQLSIRIKDI